VIDSFGFIVPALHDKIELSDLRIPIVRRGDLQLPASRELMLRVHL
jgi:hypothetical protein